MLEDFKKFAIRGNVVDMAVGVVIGAAFGGIVTNIVNNLIMPPIGLLTGGVDFSQKYILLKGPTASSRTRGVVLQDEGGRPPGRGGSSSRTSPHLFQDARADLQDVIRKTTPHGVVVVGGAVHPVMAPRHGDRPRLP